MVKHHKKTFSDNQHVFIPFVFDTFSFLAPKEIDLLQKVQRLMNNNVVSHISMNIIFKIIDFVIKK